MASTKLVINSAHQIFGAKVQISGVDYRLQLLWDDRNRNWHLSFGTLTEWLVQGERCTAGILCLRRTHDDMPPGRFSLVDTDGNGDPLEDDLGERVLLLYSEDELPEVVLEVEVLVS